jgi:hypothetical protein
MEVLRRIVSNLSLSARLIGDNAHHHLARAGPLFQPKLFYFAVNRGLIDTQDLGGFNDGSGLS